MKEQTNNPNNNPILTKKKSRINQKQRTEKINK